MTSKLKRQEGHRLLAEILKTISHLEQSGPCQMLSCNNQATALNDHSFTHPTTSALTRVGLSGQKVNVTKELTTRGNEIEVLGNEIDKLAVRISQSEPDCAIADKSDCMIPCSYADTFSRQPMMESWEDILKLVDCLKIHTQNAADYHMFHAEVNHRTKSLENFQKVAESRIDELKLTGKPEDGESLNNVIKDAMQALNMQTARVHHLTQKAPTIIPIHKRSETSRSPQPAVASAGYRNRELQFAKDENLILEDTTDDLTWRVSLRDGSTSLVPALLVLIPGPDFEALNAVKGLMTTLMEQWTWAMKHLGCLLLECLRRLLDQWNQNEGNYDALDKSQAELLHRILAQSKDVLKLWKGTPLYNEVMNLVDASVKKTHATCSMSDAAMRNNKDKPLSLSKPDINSFGEEIVYFAQLTGYHNDLEEAWRRFRMLLNLGDGEELSMDPDEMAEFLRRNFGSEGERLTKEHTDTTASAGTGDLTGLENADMTTGSAGTEDIIGMENTDTLGSAGTGSLNGLDNADTTGSAGTGDTTGLENADTTGSGGTGGITGLENADTTGSGGTEDIIGMENTDTLGSAGMGDTTGMENDDNDESAEMEHTDTTESAETEDITRSEQQQRQRLVISAITDPRDGHELGLDEAIKAGVLNMSAGLYINPKTRATKSIQEAMAEGLIQVEKVKSNTWYESPTTTEHYLVH